MANNDKRWSGRSRGGSFGYGFFIFLMNVFGIRAAYAFLSLVVVYFIPFAPRATRAVWFYNRRILRYGVFRSAVKLYAHYYALGQTIIDRVAIGSGMADRYKFEFENYDAFLRLLDGGRGAVIIGAHVGCWGTGAGFFGDYARKMHLVMYDAEYRRIKNVMDKHCKQEGYKVIPVKIPVEKIREVIGSGGKTIQKICADTGAKVDIDDDGNVFIAAVDPAAGYAAKKMIDDICFVPEVGALYYGKVVRILPIGAFVEIAPGHDGMVHISKSENRRVEKVEDVLNVGDMTWVKFMGFDRCWCYRGNESF